LRFFFQARNLKQLTPPAINMRMIDKQEQERYAGMVVSYKVAPLHGIPLP